MELIIISGIAKVGKSTLAHLIAKEAFNLGFKPIILPFAGPLKDEANARGFTKDDKPIEYREFCQIHGALKRESDPNYWVKKFEDRLIEICEEELNSLKANEPYWQRIVIVDDCRYENELSVAKKYKACTIFLSPGSRDLVDMKSTWRTHHSESMATKIEKGDNELLELFDYVITNDDDVDNLEMRAAAMSPIWTGLQPGHRHNKEEVREVINELIDLFIDEVNKEDEEEDDDRDYFSAE